MDSSAIIIVIGAGLLSGAVNSIAGGGSLVLFPALLGSGLPALSANVTNAVANWPGWVGSTYGLLGDLKQQSRRWLVYLSLITAAGSALGCVVLLATPGSAFDVVVPVLVLFASLLLAGQRQVKKLAARGRAAAAGNTRWRGAGMAIGAAGVYGGYFAGALGVIMLAVLAVTTSDGLRSLNAVKVALSLVHATVTLLIFAVFGPVHWWAVAVAAPSALVGGFLGAKVAQRMNEETLRWCVVGLGLTVSLYLFLT